MTPRAIRGLNHHGKLPVYFLSSPFSMKRNSSGSSSLSVAVATTEAVWVEVAPLVWFLAGVVVLATIFKQGHTVFPAVSLAVSQGQALAPIVVELVVPTIFTGAVLAAGLVGAVVLVAVLVTGLAGIVAFVAV